jgi:acyl-CoA dehydrogenase
MRSEDRDELLEALVRFIDGNVLVLEDKNADFLSEPAGLYGPDGTFSPRVLALFKAVRQKSAALGYYTMFADETVGGGGLGRVDLFYAWERLFHRYGPARFLPFESLAHWTTGPGFLTSHINQGLDSLVEAIMSGAATTCFAMSEPDSGSDVTSMRTVAIRDGGDWLIRGTKQWITNGPHADWAYVFAVDQEITTTASTPAISCFLVKTDQPGFHRDGVIKLFGQAGGNESILSFDDVRVGPERLVGERGKGLSLAMSGIASGKLYNAGRCVGLARWALDEALSYAQTRQTFGNPIIDYQGVSFPLADAAIQLYAARTMAVDCAQKMDRGESSVLELSMVKAYTTEVAYRIFDICMQTLGGMGLANDTRMYDGWHQSRLVRIADGSAEIMRRTIVRRLQRGDRPF